jgi:parallel beta-helix repeat protein
MRYAVANNARTRLTATLLAAHDIIHVESTSAFPLAEHPYLVSINDEILEVKPTSSTTFAILNRGCEGTTPTNHAIGDTVENRFTAGTYEGIFDEIGSGGPRTVRFVVGTSTAGWTLDDCDYLCDGTDDHVEIQQALDALPDDGGEVKLLDGTYYFEDGVTLTKDRTTLRGSGKSTKIILGEAVQSVKDVRIISLPKNYCTVADISVDGNYQWEYSVQGIYVGGSNNTITGNTCNNCSSGISVGGSNHAITGNTCNGNYENGISVSGSNHTITGNTCNNCSSGISVGGSNHAITGNTCNGNYENGISVSGSNNTITGNTCNNNYDGISLSSSSNNNTITGNTCNNNYDGIYLYSSSNNTITGNTCIRGTGQPSDYTSSQYTIHLSGSGNSYNLISSNNCMGKDVVIDGGTGNTSVNNKYN